MKNILERLNIHGTLRYVDMRPWGNKSVALRMKEQPLKFQIPIFGEIAFNLPTTGRVRTHIITDVKNLHDKLEHTSDEPLTGHN
jgi:hypothetical protein